MMTYSNHPSAKRTSNVLKKLAVVSAAGALILTGCTPSGNGDGSNGANSFEEMNPVTLKVATLYGPENWQTLPMAAFTDAITKATDGKVSFEYFYAGSLVPPAEMASGLRDGLVDLAHIVPVYTAAVFPYDNYINQLSFVSDPSPVAGSLQAAAATLQWGWETPEYLAEFEKEGLVPLLPRLQTVHTYGMLCKQDAGKLSGLAGKRTRAGGEAWANEITNLGGVPVSMPASDAYTSFQQGLLDCMISGAEDVHALGITDHGKSWNAAGFTGWSSAGVFFSESTWESLPLIAKKAIWEQLPVFLEAFFESQFATNLDFLSKGLESGVDFVTPEPDMRTKIDSYHDQVLANIAGKAPAGIDNVPAAIERWSSLHSDWLQQVTGELGLSAETKSWAEYVNQNGSATPDAADWAKLVYEKVLKDRLPTE